MNSSFVGPGANETRRATRSRRTHLFRCAFAAALIPIIGCETIDTGKSLSQGVGAVAGGMFGSKIGSRLGDENAKLLATTTGALAGAWVGGKIFDQLSREDQVAVMETTRQTAATGQPTTYSNPNTGMRMSTKVLNEGTQTRNEPVVVLKDRVEKLPPLEMVGARYIALDDTPILGGPGSDYKSVGRANKDAMVHVIAKVKEQDWYVVGENGAVSGFVPVGKFKASDTPLAANSSSATPPSGETATQTVPVTTTTRTIEQVIVLPDGTETVEKITVANTANGWEVANVN